MAKTKSIVDAGDLKKALSRLPKEGEEELRFRAIQGKVKTDSKEDSVGFFVGPQMLSAFVKEKPKFNQPTLFDGTVKRSLHKPNDRLVLISNGGGKSLRDVATECLRQAKLSYKIVVLKPGQQEPVEDPEGDNAGDEDFRLPVEGVVKQSQVTAEGKTGEAAQHLVTKFKGLAASCEKVTKRLIGGSGKQFTPVLTALKLVEQDPSPANIADLKAAALAYLEHAEKDYSEKEKKDQVNQVKILTAQKLLRELDTAEQMMKPDDAPLPQAPTSEALAETPLKNQEAAKTWERRSELMAKVLQKLVLSKERSQEIGELYRKAHIEAEKGDYTRALTLLAAVERLVKEAVQAGKEPDAKERYETARVKTEQSLEKFSKHLPNDAKQLVKLYDQAVEEATALRYNDAIIILDNIRDLQKSILERRVWERKIELSQYRVPEKTLASGAFGQTYLLEKTTPQAPGLVFKVASGQQLEAAKQMLEQEAQMLERVGDHPNIVRSLGMQTVDGQRGLVLEAVGGGTVSGTSTKLNQRLKNNLIKQEEYWGTVQFTLAQSLKGLAHMADLGYAHLDIKPDNVMYDESGEVKLIDLGLASLSGEGRKFAGTPGYMGPELVQREGEVGSQTDMFAVGGMAYESGEGRRFMYNRPYVAPMEMEADRKRFRNMFLFASNEEQALNPGDEDHPTSTVDDEGKRKKEAGRYGAETEYVKFINWLMHPDPKQRPSPREALNHPFLKDRLLSDEQAKELIQGAKFTYRSSNSDCADIREAALADGVPENLLSAFDQCQGVVKAQHMNRENASPLLKAAEDCLAASKKRSVRIYWQECINECKEKLK